MCRCSLQAVSPEPAPGEAACGVASPGYFSLRARWLYHPVVLRAPDPRGGSVTFTTASFSLEEGGWMQQSWGRAAVSSKTRSKPSAPVPKRHRPALARTGVVLSSSPRGETETQTGPWGKNAAS